MLEFLASQRVELTKESEVLPGGEIRVKGEILRDVTDGRLGRERSSRLAVDGDLSVVGSEQSADDGDRGCLPCAIGPEQPVTLVVAHGEGDIVDGRALAEPLPEALTCKHGWTLTWIPVISLEPIGDVVGGRSTLDDDDWGAVESIIRLDR